MSNKGAWDKFVPNLSCMFLFHDSFNVYHYMTNGISSLSLFFYNKDEIAPLTRKKVMLRLLKMPADMGDYGISEDSHFIRKCPFLGPSRSGVSNSRPTDQMWLDPALRVILVYPV